MTATRSALSIALSIWTRAVIANALLIGIYVFFEEGFVGSLFLIFSLIIGFFVTLPMLVVIPCLIKLAAKIPYEVEGRLAGLTFLLILLVVLFYAIVSYVFGGNLFDVKYYQLIVLSSIIAVVLATRSVKNSFSKFNYNNHEQRLV